jgi:hypothetical protein
MFNFDIAISDPDTGQATDAITKLDIVTDGGNVVQSYEVTPPAHEVRWQTTVKDRPTSTYFFVRVWNASGGDIPNPDSNRPVAWLAPVWTGQ